MKNKQRGWSLWGLIAVGGLIVFFTLLFLRLFPAYFDNMKLREGLETLIAEHNVEAMSRAQIIRRLDDILYIDFAHEVVDLGRSLQVIKGQGTMEVRIDYETVIPLAFNISALLDFKNGVQVPVRQ